MVVTPESEEQAVGTINVTADDFKATIDDNDIVLVDWWASWCGPCRMFAPVFEKAAAEHHDIVFAKIDTEAESALAGALGIMSIPTLMVFREGVLVFSQPGALPGRGAGANSSPRSASSTWDWSTAASPPLRPRADGSSPSPSCEFRVPSPFPRSPQET